MEKTATAIEKTRKLASHFINPITQKKR